MSNPCNNSGNIFHYESLDDTIRVYRTRTNVLGGDDYLEKLRKVLKEIIINSDEDEQAKRILQEIMEEKVA